MMKVVDDNESDNSFLRSFLRTSLRKCISGGERDRTQQVFETPKCDQLHKAPIAPSQSDCDLSKPCDQPLNSSSQLFTDDTSEINVSFNTATTVSTNSDASNLSSKSDSSNLDSEYDYETSDKALSFLTFRLSYLFVTLVVMLADGLQGKRKLIQRNSLVRGRIAWKSFAYTVQ